MCATDLVGREDGAEGGGHGRVLRVADNRWNRLGPPGVGCGGEGLREGEREGWVRLMYFRLPTGHGREGQGRRGWGGGGGAVAVVVDDGDDDGEVDGRLAWTRRAPRP